MRSKKMIIGSSILLVTVVVLLVAVIQGNVINRGDAAEDSGVRTSSNDVKLAQSAVKATESSKPERKKKRIHISNESDQSENESDQSDDKKSDEQVGDFEEESVTYSTQYVNVSSLNVRSGPGTDYDAVGTVTINQSIEASEKAEENGWVNVSSDTVSGYVNGKYLSDEKVKAQQADQDDKDSESIDHQKSNNDKPDKKDNTKKPKQNDADKLNTIDSNNQLILVTTNGYGTNQARVQTFERNGNGKWDQKLDVSGFIGKRGFSGSKQEGDMKSPTGKYTIGTAFGRSGDPGTKLPFRNITPDDVWVDDPDSKLYNTWQSKQETKDQWSSAENMDIPLYTYGFVINYNTNRTPGAGSAIFFHIANSYTAGCTGVSQGNMVSILKWLDPAKNPVIIQTPVSELGSY